MKRRNVRKQCKGAVSIFLIIIFLSCYILTGLLVDGGRYRMAMAMAESSLDSAADSILSRYNKLVYDLYGLLATENLTQEELVNQFQTYVSDTLDIGDIDYSDYQTLLGQVLAGSVSEEGQYFDGYDFQIKVEAGNSVTLATTENVEYQIIEHMKYRGPVQLVGQAGSFLNELEQILSVKNRIQAASERIQITNSNKALFQDCSDLIDDINLYNDHVRAFSLTADYTAQMDMGSTVCWNIHTYIMDFEKKVKELHREEKEEIQRRIEEAEEEAEEEESEGDEDGESEGGGGVDEDAIKQEVMEEYNQSFSDLIQEYHGIFPGNLQSGFIYLYDQGQSLYERVTAANERYEAYIKELEGKLSQHSDDEDYKTVFLPEIELAKANCGEILKNIDVIVNARGYAGEVERIYYQGGISDTMKTEAERFVEKVRSDEESGVALPAGRESTAFVEQVDESMIKLQDISGYFYRCRQQEINVRNGDTKIDAKADTKDQESKEQIKDLKEEDLQISFTPRGDAGEGPSLDFSDNQEWDTEEAGAVMNAGLAFMDMLGSLLEGARDRIYVDEYILRTFPNAVYHYNMSQSDRDTSVRQADSPGTKYDTEWDSGPDYLLEDNYWKYCATEAEVEYILTGIADGSRAVDNVEARLLGIRTILNGVAIFTDSAKINQANAIASLSGPFAPLVSILLLLGWAVAESVLDVIDLMAGKKVAFWKQGADWTLSVEGALERVVNEVKDDLVRRATDWTDQMFDMVEVKLNGAIYDIYNGIQGAEEAMDKTFGQLETAAAQSGDGAVQSAMETISGGYRAASGEISSVVTDAKDRAVAEVTEKTMAMKEKTQDAIRSKLSSAAEGAMEKLAGKIPVGQVVSTGGVGDRSFKLGYSDYMRIFLLMMNQQTKVERIQRVIQANLRYGGQSEFSMEQSYTGVWADMECTVKFLFMSEPIIPSDLKKSGRLKFKVQTSRAY